jgi:hypothetical protein
MSPSRAGAGSPSAKPFVLIELSTGSNGPAYGIVDVKNKSARLPTVTDWRALKVIAIAERLIATYVDGKAHRSTPRGS